MGLSTQPILHILMLVAAMRTLNSLLAARGAAVVLGALVVGLATGRRGRPDVDPGHVDWCFTGIEEEKCLRIIVDADGCPGKAIIVKVARAAKISVLLVADTNHRFEDGYSEVLLVDPGRDAADIALVNQIAPGDVVVTQDYGVASMSLAKRATPVHPTGFIYTEDNIQRLMFERHLGQKPRRAGKRTRGPKPRSAEDDHRLEMVLTQLCPG